MSSSLDRASVIEAITDGIGVHFGRAARRSFYQQLERLESHEPFARLSPNKQQFLIDLLALAAFYQTVVTPIRGSAKFVSILRKAGATHLRVADDKLGYAYARRAGVATKAFQSILSRSQIPEILLTYPTLKQFIRSADSFMQGDDKWQHRG